MAKSLNDRVDILERAFGATLGVDLSEFDPEAIQAKADAAAKAYADQQKAEQDVRDAQNAQVRAQQEAEAKAKEWEDARAQAILDEKNKKKA